MNPSKGGKKDVGDIFYQTDERLLLGKFTKIAEVIGHGCPLRQKSSQNISREKTNEYTFVLGELNLSRSLC